MEYATIPKLARLLDVSDATIRRHIKNYSQFFEAVQIDGWEQYPVEKSVIILKRIIEVSAAGKRRNEALSVLLSEFEVKSDSPVQESAAITEFTELGPKTLAVLSDIRDSLKMIAQKSAS